MLVVGAGKVALRKTRGLLEAGARVTVVAPEWEPEFETLPVELVRRRFRASDLGDVALVFAATIVLTLRVFKTIRANRNEFGLAPA